MFISGTGSHTAEQRHALALGHCLGGRHRHAEDRVRAERGLVRGAVELDEPPIELALIGRVLPLQRLEDRPGDVGDGLEHALATVALGIAIPQLQRLMAAGGRA
jgi:hypothetical protein